ncbi:cytochrome c biogenesis protein DipZ [Patescibacteria group bacterium]
MLILVLFSFIAGVVTILSPCILPLLPIILSSSANQGKKHPLGVIVGFILSFTFFTLFLSIIVNLTGISSDFLRNISVIVILLFGLILVIPALQRYFEIFASKIASKASNTDRVYNPGFVSGIFVGISLGLVWTPCVGPILASVISLAITGTVTGSAFLIILAYSLGTAIPMLIIMFSGQQLFTKIPFLLKNLGKIQKLFGVLMIIVAVSIFFNYDRIFQTYILEKFPNYGLGLTSIEDNELVQKELLDFRESPYNTDDMGKPLFDYSLEMVKAPEIIAGGQWFNSDPLKISELEGQVVVLDFWTYSCINCIRTLPFVQSWYEKYEDSGLVVIGVHTPEFEFEKDSKNLQEAIDDFGLTYPIVQDNDYETWRAYSNRYWPAKYFIDKNGNLRDIHIGEGDYDDSEKLIQELLNEAGYDTDYSINNPTYDIFSITPETYLGYDRILNFASSEPILKDELSSYSFSDDLPTHHIAFSGDWIIKSESSNPQKGASLIINFESKNVFLVMSPKNSKSGRIEVFLDDQKVDEFGTLDVVDGIITVDQDRLYEVIDLDKSGQHLLRFDFLDENVEVYAFTFG